MLGKSSLVSKFNALSGLRINFGISISNVYANINHYDTFVCCYLLEDFDKFDALCFPFLCQAVLLCSCILAFFLNYSIFLNTTLNSALTQTICGNLKVCYQLSFASSIYIVHSFAAWGMKCFMVLLPTVGLFELCKVI